MRLILVNAFEDYDDRGSRERMLEQLRELGIEWPVVDGDLRLRRAFDVRKIPSVFVYDGDGALVRAFRRHEGPPPTVQELSTYLSSP